MSDQKHKNIKPVKQAAVKPKSKPGKKKKSFTPQHGELLKKTMISMKGLLKQKAEFKALSDSFDKKGLPIDWVDVKGGSSNPYADKIQLVDTNISALKSMLSSELKGMNVPIRLTALFGTTNSSSGVGAFVVALDPAWSQEFASVQALFEEIRCHKVDIAYYPKSRQLQTFVGIAGPSASGMGAISIDSFLATALTSTIDAYDATYHALYNVPIVSLATTAEAITHQTVHMVYHPPSAPFPNTAAFGAVPIAGSSWTSTAGSATSGTSGVDVTGYFKLYETNSMSSGTAIGALYTAYDCQVRMRD